MRGLSPHTHFLLTPGNPRKPWPVCGPGIGGRRFWDKGVSSGTQAEMGEEDRLRGLQALLASPCLPSSFTCSQGFPVSPCPSHLCPPFRPGPGSYLSWTHTLPWGPPLYLPPLASPQGLSTGLLARYSLPDGVCFCLVTVTWSVTGPPTCCDVRTTKKNHLPPNFPFHSN